MRRPKSYPIYPNHLRNAKDLRHAQALDPPKPATPLVGVCTVRTIPRDFINSIEYRHPHDSMARLARALSLRYDAIRTRHAYFRQLFLVHGHFALDSAILTADQLRAYFLLVKLKIQWKPKSIRQALAATRNFFVDLLGHSDLRVGGQIRIKGHEMSPAVLTRRQVNDLLVAILLSS